MPAVSPRAPSLPEARGEAVERWLRNRAGLLLDALHEGPRLAAAGLHLALRLAAVALDDASRLVRRWRSSRSTFVRVRLISRSARLRAVLPRRSYLRRLVATRRCTLRCTLPSSRSALWRETVYGLTTSSTSSRAVSAAPTGISTARSACACTT